MIRYGMVYDDMLCDIRYDTIYDMRYMTYDTFLQ